MRSPAALVLFAVAAGSALTAIDMPGLAAAAPALGDRPLDWQTVLVAGDDSVPAFDNGISALRDTLIERGVTDVVELRASTDTATAADVGAAIEGIAAGPGEGCLVYITTHGKDTGVLLADDGYSSDADLLSPDELTAMLDTGCGRAPTVVIVSACHSGAFITDTMSQPNRIVIAAARTDRTSFGCSDDHEFTFFDECVLGALPEADAWAALFDAAAACVDAKEAELDYEPSLPQYFEGDAAMTIGMPRPIAEWLKAQ